MVAKRDVADASDSKAGGSVTSLNAPASDDINSGGDDDNNGPLSGGAAVAAPPNELPTWGRCNEGDKVGRHACTCSNCSGGVIYVNRVDNSDAPPSDDDN